MGVDCCGTVPATPPTNGLEQLDISDSSASNSGNDRKTNGNETIYQEDFSPSEFKVYNENRLNLFDQYKQRQDEKKAKAQKIQEEINVKVINDGSERTAIKGVTSTMDLLKQIDKKLQKAALSVDVDGSIWDLLRPLETNCTIKILTWEDPKGKDTFWHSSSHVFGEALESLYGVRLTIGPAVEEGFYYDCYYGSKTLGDADKASIEKKVVQLANAKHPFQRVEVTREEALEMFGENKFKVEIISNLPEGCTITLYRSGEMVDLCRGPHLPNTGYLKAAMVGNLNRAFWRGDTKNAPLQRVYGVTFPDKEKLADYKMRMEEAKKRDHRAQGVKQELFFFDKLSPGSCFFLPNGARIYNLLIDFIRGKYWEYEYDEVVTPNIYNFDLWKTSGHSDHYKQNMFHFEIEKQEFGLKPMNCPGHCVMFAHRAHSYRELPLRFADFGVLHRNEYSGALTGLTRVRRFQQDDAHIFCREDQVTDEVGKCLQMLSEVYEVFGLSYTAELSTRPESKMGDDSQWDLAESALQNALDAHQAQTGQAWEVNEGDGAFYGPKIDITVYDALRRKFQCATIQLDFQLPQRFNLRYADPTDESGYKRPVIIHRAILGSVERMFAILTEHFAGKWPLWLSPRQVMVIPISQAFIGYAEEVRRKIRKEKFFVSVDAADNKMEKKVAEAQVQQYNYILVVGKQEETKQTVNVRTRDKQRRGEHSVDDVLKILQDERAKRSQISLFPMPTPDATAVKAAAKSQNAPEEVKQQAKAA